jgi:hypothetical protein
MEMVSMGEFWTRTLGGRPSQMDMSADEGAPFSCACGMVHQYHQTTVTVLRELRQMRLVLVCPKGRKTPQSCGGTEHA